MINRHYDEPKEFLMDDLTQYAESWGDILEAIKNRPGDNLGPELRESLYAFSMSIVGNSEKNQIRDLLIKMKSIGIANFEFSLKPGETFTVHLGGESFELIGQPVTAYMDTNTWLIAYYSAVVARDMSGINTLCQVPEIIHQNANLKPDHFDLSFVRAMKGLFNPDVNIGQLLVDAMEASDPSKIDMDRLNYASNILLPQLPLYRCILSSDQEEFNEKLEEAVLKHRDFWGTNEKQYDRQGWIALPLIAAGAIAYDNKGFEITFETDYIPSWLAKGELMMD